MIYKVRGEDVIENVAGYFVGAQFYPDNLDRLLSAMTYDVTGTPQRNGKNTTLTIRTSDAVPGHLATVNHNDLKLTVFDTAIPLSTLVQVLRPQINCAIENTAGDNSSTDVRIGFLEGSTRHRISLAPSGIRYTGEIGVTWIRCNIASPLRLFETVVTSEVTFLTWTTAFTILGASKDEETYFSLVNALRNNATDYAIGAMIAAALGIKGVALAVSTIVLGTVLDFGWHVLRQWNREEMQRVFNEMQENTTTAFLRVGITSETTTGNVGRTFSVQHTTGHFIPIPFDGVIGDWYPDKVSSTRRVL